jgi:uncharacterized protein (TIGR00730 family)
MNLCVFSSSSDIIAPEFFAVAEELGAALARRGDVLVYGGCSVGLMGAMARAVHRHGGRVVGIIPTFIHQRGLAYDPADELIVTQTMRDRKAQMESRADCFLALPGGFGTLEEMLEIITLKQLAQHTKPVIFLNVSGFYDPLASLFAHMLEQRFVKAASRELYHFAASVDDVFAYLETYTAPRIELKWFKTKET